MTRTVTYDETQWKLMPIEPTEEMIGADIEPLYGMDMALAYKTMLNYAPPYPESNCKEILDSWIPVSERLPENDLLVLIFTDNNDIITGSYSSVDYEGCWRIGNSSIIWDHNFNLNIIVNKWMPMPAAPKGEE